MDCRNFRRNHLGYVDGTLSDLEREAMREHTARCDACSRQDTKVRRALMVARSLPPIWPSAGFAERFERRMREAKADGSASWTGLARRDSRGPGIGEFFAATAGVVAAGFLMTAALERFDNREPVVLPAVLAQAPPEPALPLAAPAFVASASPIVSVWPVALMIDQAPLHFATAQLAVGGTR